MNLARMSVRGRATLGGEVVASRARPLVRSLRHPSPVTVALGSRVLLRVAQDGASEPTKKPAPRLGWTSSPSRVPEYSRNVVQSWIAQGKVLVNGQPVTKAGTKLRPDVKIVITAEQPKYVCRGGLKLEKALDEFEIDPDGSSPWTPA